MLLRLELACLFCVAKGLIDKQTTYTCTWHSYTRSVFSNHPPLPLLHSPSPSTPICLFWLKDNFSVPVTDVISKLLPPMRLVVVERVIHWNNKFMPYYVGMLIPFLFWTFLQHPAMCDDTNRLLLRVFNIDEWRTCDSACRATRKGEVMFYWFCAIFTPLHPMHWPEASVECIFWKAKETLKEELLTATKYHQGFANILPNLSAAISTGSMVVANIWQQFGIWWTTLMMHI